MDNEFKRRAFLAVIFGTLLGTPIAARLIRGWKPRQEEHYFSTELNRVQTLLHVPIQPVAGPESFTLRLHPPVGREWKYVVFAPSFLPENLSQTLGNEPDMFLLKEGQLAVNQTNKGQIVFSGRDTNFSLHSPYHTEKRPNNETILLVRDGALRLAEPKGEIIAHSDQQFLHLLALPGIPKEMTVGQKWNSTTGRVKPFENCPTEYEVAGFAEVAGRKAVDIRFKGSIPNVAQLPGVNFHQPDKEASMSNAHEGNAYFDLETGLLVRQEVSMTTTCHDNEFVGKDGLTVKANYIVQLFHA